MSNKIYYPDIKLLNSTHPKSLKHKQFPKAVNTHWQHREGIPVHKGAEPRLRVLAVYTTLLDIPEAITELEKCNKKVETLLEIEYITLCKPIFSAIRAGQEVDLPSLTETQSSKIEAIYQDWVTRWCIGSSKMLEWVIGRNLPEVIQYCTLYCNSPKLLANILSNSQR